MTLEQVKSMLAENVVLSEEISVLIGKKVTRAKMTGVKLDPVSKQAVLEYTADKPAASPRKPKTETIPSTAKPAARK